MDRKFREGDDEKNALEWFVFGFSLMLVLSVLSYLSYHALRTEADPKPDLEVLYLFDPSEFAPYRYLITVKNRGHETAEQVSIEVSLLKGEEQLETAELQLPFAPKESVREGWVIFRRNPTEADTIVARVKSYKRP